VKHRRAAWLLLLPRDRRSRVQPLIERLQPFRAPVFRLREDLFAANAVN
jgi:hypothetical protein